LTFHAHIQGKYTQPFKIRRSTELDISLGLDKTCSRFKVWEADIELSVCYTRISLWLFEF